MDHPDRQTVYWDRAGATKSFTHPLHGDWLTGLRPDARILDYGCGYGRVLAELSDRGFSRLLGVDISAALLTRGRRSRPDLTFELITAPPALAHPAGAFDLVVLFAVLTCIPGDEAQRDLIAELRRLLAPGGHLYVSDLTLQSDDRHQRRYASYAESSGAPYGVFATDDGAVFRHHDAAHLRGLLSEFDLVAERPIDVSTMNGHRVTGRQMLARAG